MLCFFLLFNSFVYFSTASAITYYPLGGDAHSTVSCTHSSQSNLFWVTPFRFEEDATVNKFSYIPCGDNNRTPAHHFLIYTAQKVILYSQPFYAQANVNSNNIPVNETLTSPVRVKAGLYYVGFFINSSSLYSKSFYLRSRFGQTHSSFYTYSFTSFPVSWDRSPFISPYNQFIYLTLATQESECSSLDNDCVSCIKDSKCSWCLDSERCIDKTASGCPNRSNNPKRCGCYGATSCKQCTGLGKNCNWCEGSSGDSCVLSSSNTSQCDTVISNPGFCD